MTDEHVCFWIKDVDKPNVCRICSQPISRPHHKWEIMENEKMTVNPLSEKDLYFKIYDEEFSWDSEKGKNEVRELNENLKQMIDAGYHRELITEDNFTYVKTQRLKELFAELKTRPLIQHSLIILGERPVHEYGISWKDIEELFGPLAK